uniref:Uncharacterized protein n=1 Tax=Anguilla anguilla TaxID=7936 RepID=A0A0E9UT65_ANGAN
MICILLWQRFTCSVYGLLLLLIKLFSSFTHGRSIKSCCALEAIWVSATPSTSSVLHPHVGDCEKSL